MKYSKEFLALVAAYKTFHEIPRYLRVVTLAQWILESGRGGSNLAKDHFNFGGLKWRKEMQSWAQSVPYKAHDGLEDYCQFNTVQEFIVGYWQFIKRSPYNGWGKVAGDGNAFMNFIGPIYCPTPGYVKKVEALYAEADELLK